MVVRIDDFRDNDKVADEYSCEHKTVIQSSYVIVMVSLYEGAQLPSDRNQNDWHIDYWFQGSGQGGP